MLDARRWLISSRGAAQAGSVSEASASARCTGAIRAPMAAVDHHHGARWVSFLTLAAARGRGVASTGLTAVAAWALDGLDLHRLELGHRPDDPTPCRVATAAGLAVEGLEREKLRYGDQCFDVELHARLASDPSPAPAGTVR